MTGWKYVWPAASSSNGPEMRIGMGPGILPDEREYERLAETLEEINKESVLSALLKFGKTRRKNSPNICGALYAFVCYRGPEALRLL